MSEMVKRLAATIRDMDNGHDGDPVGVLLDLGLSHITFGLSEEKAQAALEALCERIARGVLFAMLEPTATMVLAGTGHTDGSCQPVWRAMVTAALSPAAPLPKSGDRP